MPGSVLVEKFSAVFLVAGSSLRTRRGGACVFMALCCLLKERMFDWEGDSGSGVLV